ncbi:MULTISPECIES: hypothetical protein [Virgibacillus]|uniref:Uncharacterized protein n=1 Tax=Virgibacillus pantothenticus TaxID=1473 RepID=A0A0L0QMW9_VIRPA|nr:MULTISPECIES: hypothetical protein [Virgibacillus]API93678.1 hypothetical protein BKP57_18780 [Virgibacillus sp. 6R]KNE19965.1 hypothetical protein AFK71_16295 [Virgibacillus pantothenticus]MBS7429921.1 hypothetical protein [Virgibacillus sp. 19R1-5]MED3736374.1 hypothetical protein [Virgibacillus pantothenticus]QTY18293.1 hypothetical protein KBP50_10920 [Virgibacillus pantothenticus]
MKSIFTGSFSQVEETISENFMKDTINAVKNFKIHKLIIVILFFSVSSYAVYGVSFFLATNIDDLAVPFDKNNEFIFVFSSIWYIHIQVFIFFIAGLAAFIYKERNHAKGYFLFNIFLSLGWLLFLLFTFKLTQLMVNSYILRMLYSVLFLSGFVFVFFQSYQNAKKMVYGTKKKRSALVEWLSKNRKNVLSILFGFGALYYLTKVISPEVDNLETRIIGSLIEFAPLAVCLIFFTFIYLNSKLIRSYYLYKYSEEFRKKFGIAKKDWYGEKYKG